WASSRSGLTGPASQRTGWWASGPPPERRTETCARRNLPLEPGAEAQLERHVVRGGPGSATGMGRAEVRVQSAERELRVVVVVERLLGVQDVERVRSQDDTLRAAAHLDGVVEVAVQIRLGVCRRLLAVHG